VVSLYVRGLPRDVYVLQAGLLLNAFGNGAANPFTLLYLHDVRGIPLAVAGLASGVAAASALCSALLSGALTDRIGGRWTMIGGLALSTLGFALYPLVHHGWQAVALAVLLGGGTGAWLTGQSALLARLVDSAQRPLAFAQQRVAANVGLGLGGAVGGLIVVTSDPTTFTALFLLNAATFLAYAGFLVHVREPTRSVAAAAVTGSYRVALRDRPFTRLLAVNYAFVASAIALLVGVFPVYAKGEAGVTEDEIGLLFLVNSLLIIALQVRVARREAGRRRMTALARMGTLFAASWLLVLVAGLVDGHLAALAALGAAIAVFSLAECLYDAVQGPIVADLAPEGLVGRYMALNGFSWQLGFITGPPIAAAVLGASPNAVWPLAAAVCLVGAVGALRLERRLPDEAVMTPVSAPA
jgi:MFS family permease